MSLDFSGANSHRVDHGSAAQLDTLTSWTMIMWSYRTGSTTFRAYFDKSSPRMYTPGAGATQVAIRTLRASINTLYVTNNANLTTNKWWYVVGTYNESGAAGEIHNIYRGDLTTPATECTYSTTTDGSGSTSSDATSNLLVGNNVSLIEGYEGIIAFAAYYNTELSLDQIIQQQWNIWYPVVAFTNCLVFTNYGFNGTGSQRDWSGNGNHGTVTGATVAAHVPLSTQVPMFIRPTFVEPPAAVGDLNVSPSEASTISETANIAIANQISIDEVTARKQGVRIY